MMNPCRVQGQITSANKRRNVSHSPAEVQGKRFLSHASQMAVADDVPVLFCQDLCVFWRTIRKFASNWFTKFEPFPRFETSTLQAGLLLSSYGTLPAPANASDIKCISSMCSYEQYSCFAGTLEKLKSIDAIQRFGITILTKLVSLVVLPLWSVFPEQGAEIIGGFWEATNQWSWFCLLSCLWATLLIVEPVNWIWHGNKRHCD